MPARTIRTRLRERRGEQRRDRQHEDFGSLKRARRRPAASDTAGSTPRLSANNSTSIVPVTNSGSAVIAERGHGDGVVEAAPGAQRGEHAEDERERYQQDGREQARIALFLAGRRSGS